MDGHRGREGDLPHDDTTWATVTVDDATADVGIYHYYEDHDWFAVELADDSNYVFFAIASGAYSSYLDPALRLYDDAGTELAVEYLSGNDISVDITHSVGTGEGGTYYLDVSNAVLMDDAGKLATLGITEPFEIYSPFIGTRYFVWAVQAENRMGRRSTRSVPGNALPWILNRTSITQAENTGLREYITANDPDSEESITGYEISGGADEGLFAISSKGKLTMAVTPDYEVPADSNMDNAYEVQVRVTSGSSDRERSTTADFTVTVTDDDTEADRVLVSNTGRRDSGSDKVENSDSAVRIRTGSNDGGYVIHSVDLRFWEALEDPSGVRVSLWSSHKPGQHSRPNAEFFAFVNPSNIEARLTEFTAPPDTVLEPDTDYYLMIERTGDTATKFLETGSDSQDSISEADWDIGGLRFHRPRNMSGPWSNRKVGSDREQLKLRVIGHEYSGD